VLNGDGQVTVDGETATIQKGDAVPIRFNEAHSFAGGSNGLELMIMGISSQKNVIDTELGGRGRGGR
jgi:quercetin dioxygenase-like cupin family protein